MYNKKIWKDGEMITKEALNNIENGISELSDIESSGTYFINLEKWGIHNGFLSEREYIQNEDGSYQPKYTKEEYDIAHNNKEGLNAALKYAADNGYASAVLPKHSEIFIAWEEANENCHAYYAYNLEHIMMPSNLDFNMNYSTIKVIFDSKNRNPYDLSIHDYNNPIYRIQGHVITFKSCYNSSIRNGTLLGTSYERAFIEDSVNEQGLEKNFDMGTGIFLKQGSSFIKIENMTIKGFMADGISSISTSDPAMGPEITDPAFNNKKYIDTATGELIDSDGTDFCTDLLSIENWKCKEGTVVTNIGYTRVPNVHKQMFYLYWYDSNKEYLFNTRTRYLQNFLVPEQAKYVRVLLKKELDQEPGFKKTFKLTPKAGEFCLIKLCDICENRRGGISNMLNNTIIEYNKIYNNGLGKYEGLPQFGDTTRYGINCEDCLPANIIVRNNYFNEMFHAILFAGGNITCRDNIFNEIQLNVLNLYNCETAYFINNKMTNSGYVGATENSVYNRSIIMKDNIWIGATRCFTPVTNNMKQNISGIIMDGCCHFENASGRLVRDVKLYYSRYDNVTYAGGTCKADDCENIVLNIDGRCISTARVKISSNKNTKNFTVKNVSETEECCIQFDKTIYNAEIYDTGEALISHIYETQDDGIIKSISALTIENTYMRNVITSNNFYNQTRPFEIEFKIKNSVIEFDDNHTGINNLTKFKDFIFPYQYAACPYENTIDIVFEDCTFNFNQAEAKNIFAANLNMYITGRLVFKNCHFNNNSGADIKLIELNNMNREEAHIDLIIENCTFNGEIKSTNPSYPFKGTITKDGIELQPNDSL